MSDGQSPHFLPVLRKDIRAIIHWSEEKFGPLAADRYAALIQQALHDIYEDPRRPGAKARPDLAPHAFVYHLAFSRDNVVGEKVREPRHFVLYRYSGAAVEFARILHDSRDLIRHMPRRFRS